MPILNVEHARHVIIYNWSRAPGYAGVENTLYDAPNAPLFQVMLGLATGPRRFSAGRGLERRRELWAKRMEQK